MHQKKMPLSVKKDLERAAEMIVTGQEDAISDCIGFDWLSTYECHLVHGLIGHMYPSEKLMLIAIMLTMPSYILNHKCR